MEYEEKKRALQDYLLELTKHDVAVAFSGGVDSSLLLHQCCKAAKQNSTKVYAVTMQTELHPQSDIVIARKVANEAGAKHIVIKIDELEEAGIGMNPENRCYLCKLSLFKKIQEEACRLGISIIVEGTNDDDLHVYRPGIQALKELNIISPLARFNIGKEEVRKMAEELGISVSGRASTPCMATRFPYGTKLSKDLMQKVAKMEEWLRNKGVYNVRLRVHDNIGRFEVDHNDMPLFLEQWKEITERTKQIGLDYVTLDLEGFRSGSMDIKMKINN